MISTHEFLELQNNYHDLQIEHGVMSKRLYELEAELKAIKDEVDAELDRQWHINVFGGFVD